MAQESTTLAAPQIPSQTEQPVGRHVARTCATKRQLTSKANQSRLEQPEIRPFITSQPQTKRTKRRAENSFRYSPLVMAKNPLELKLTHGVEVRNFCD
jgi:hypothetical protein